MEHQKKKRLFASFVSIPISFYRKMSEKISHKHPLEPPLCREYCRDKNGNCQKKMRGYAPLNHRWLRFSKPSGNQTVSALSPSDRLRRLQPRWRSPHSGATTQPPRQALPATPPQEGNFVLCCLRQAQATPASLEKSRTAGQPHNHPVRRCLPPLHRRGKKNKNPVQARGKKQKL